MRRNFESIAHPVLTSLPIAVRVYPHPKEVKHKKRQRGRWQLPAGMFVLDCETRTDATQGLTFGSYRFIEDGECKEEGLFCADDLPAEEWGVLQRYTETHIAAAV